MEQHVSLSIAIPAYNEESSILNVVEKAVSAARRNASQYEILIVDDGSTDQTGNIGDSVANKNRHIRVIHHSKNQGFSGAIKTCYTKASYDLVFLLPADGQIDPFDVKIFLDALADADVVVGYRIHNPEPFMRRFNSFVFHIVYKLLFGVRLREISTSILWRKSVLDSLNITATPNSALIEPEVVYKAWKKGFVFHEVAIPYYPRVSGQPK